MATAATLAALPAAERRLLFTEAAARLQLAPLILEKDFWVGWLLGRLFALPQRQGHFQFKGGTSLSMVFGAVRRFSEDIDLAILPATLGFDEAYFNEAPSTNQRRKRMEQLTAASESYVQALQPELEADVSGVLGPRAAPGWFTYEIDAAAATPNLLFHYPSVTANEFAYVPKRVKMEFGSLTNQQPATRAVARTLMVRVLPEGTLADLQSDVVVLDVARTFWEKATILHAEYHRPPPTSALWPPRGHSCIRSQRGPRVRRMAIRARLAFTPAARRRSEFSPPRSPPAPPPGRRPAR